jgi:hypothetical protein
MFATISLKSAGGGLRGKSSAQGSRIIKGFAVRTRWVDLEKETLKIFMEGRISASENRQAPENATAPNFRKTGSAENSQQALEKSSEPRAAEDQKPSHAPTKQSYAQI